MKKLLKKAALAVITIASVFGLAACGQDPLSERNNLIVGATSVPHAELLNLIKEDFESFGYKLEIKEFSDYTLVNPATADGSLDVNFFQHSPYLESYNSTSGNNLVSVGAVHVEPIGLYSNSYSDIANLTSGEIALPEDPSNLHRALLLLEAYDLIELAEDVETYSVTDITDANGFTFKTVAAELLSSSLQDVDAAVINTNYALLADLNPQTDALIIENADSPYANIVVVKSGNEEDEKVLKLYELLTSEKVKNYINDNYGGAVVAVF